MVHGCGEAILGEGAGMNEGEASFGVCAKTHSHRDAVHQKRPDRDRAMVLD